MTDLMGNRYLMDNRQYPPRRTLSAGFAHLPRLHRRAAGYGIREAADIMGIDRGYLSRIERGHRCPSPAVAERIAELYCLPIAISDSLMAAAALTRAYGRSIGVC
jgi:transcriptional regulator with XRE-family HTH domain